MRRAVARGRIFPQSYSTDRRYGRLSLKACALFPLMWANADDQGRLPGEPEEVKYACCPNIDHITKTDIPLLLEELDKNKLIKLYQTSKTQAIQMLDWWQVQRLQWAWPSDYPPPEGWQDRLRYKRGAKEVVTENWPSQVSTQVNNNPLSGERSGEPSKIFPLTTSIEKGRGKRRGRGRGNSPESSGERSPPSPADLTTDNHKILDKLLESFRFEFGRVPAESPGRIIPREPLAKERAQLRDLALEISTAGGCPLSYIREVFREAASQEEKSKKSVSYVRAILFAWLGPERGPPG